MKAEYQVRTTGEGRITAWLQDAKYLQENHRHPLATLWRRQTETPEDAAVRRMTALDNADKWQNGSNMPIRKPFELSSAYADRLCPPPAANEVQVDWDTLEPIKEVPVWQHHYGCWIAGVDGPGFNGFLSQGVFFDVALTGILAIGSTRENALRNLAELQQIKTK